MIKAKSHKVSLFTLFAIFFAIIFAFPWSGNWHVISWDTFGYYIYLPEFFIYHNPGITNYDQMLQLVNQYEVSSTFYHVHPHPNGNYISQYPIGMAIIYLPAFFIGHVFALLFHFPLDGLSKPYEWSMLLEHFFMLFAGMLMLRIILLKFFTDKVTALILTTLIIGTNFLYQAYWAIPSLHMYIFTLYCLFILIVMNWHQKPTLLNSTLLGAVLGLITLCRVTDFIAVLIPLLWGIQSRHDFMNRAKELLFGRLLWASVLTVFAFAIIIAPQLIFWKIYTGEWLYYSYKNAGEGFDFLTPHIFNFLMSFRKGWFIYTPIMLLILPGLYAMYKAKSKLLLLIFVFLIVDVYILSSWSCWWYAGGFSQRSMVQAYGLLALPIGYFYTHLLMRKSIIQIGMGFIVGALIMLNIFQTWQAGKKILHPSQTTWAYYKAVFGKTYIPDGAQRLLLVRRSLDGQQLFDDTSDYRLHHQLFVNFEKANDWMTTQHSQIRGFNSSTSLLLSDLAPFSEVIRIPFELLSDHTDHAWVKIRFKYFSEDSLSQLKPTAVLSFLNQKNETYDYNGVGLENIKTNQLATWNTFEYTFLTPEVRNEKDNFSFYFWIRGKGTLFVDDLEIQSFVKK